MRVTGGDRRLQQGDQLRGFLNNLGKGYTEYIYFTVCRAGVEEEVLKGYLGRDRTITIAKSVSWTYWMWEEKGEQLSMTSRLCRFCCRISLRQLCINMTF